MVYHGPLRMEAGMPSMQGHMKGHVPLWDSCVSGTGRGEPLVPMPVCPNRFASWATIHQTKKIHTSIYAHRTIEYIYISIRIQYICIVCIYSVYVRYIMYIKYVIFMVYLYMVWINGMYTCYPDIYIHIYIYVYIYVL